jgi:hypothetical protein
MDSPKVVERITLPIRWGPDRSGRVLLTRRFGRPPIVSLHQELFLIMEQVPGVLSISLNDVEFSDISPEQSSFQHRLQGLPPRNVLTLCVESERARAGPDAQGSDWGFISLAIRDRDDGEPSFRE